MLTILSLVDLSRFYIRCAVKLFSLVMISYLSFFNQPVHAKLVVDESLIVEKSININWLNLLYYEGNETSGFISEADAADFFLSNNGKYNPSDELKVIISHLITKESQVATFCKFPARSKWVILQFQLPIRQPVCKGYDDWRLQLVNHQLSIVFATPYMGDPASFVGHTFFKFTNKNNTDLASPTINYAAKVDANVGPLNYIYNGVAGRFSGRIDTELMYRRFRRYAHDEGRDLWEFKLDLSGRALETLIDHAWEIKGTVFKYHFFDENCSYRLVGLLRAALPQQISLQPFSGVALPIETIKYIHQKGLITETVYWPSPENSLRNSLGKLTKREKSWFIYLVNYGAYKMDSDFTQSNVSQQYHILMLAQKYIGHQIESGATSSALGGDKVFSIIKAMSELQFEPTSSHFNIEAGNVTLSPLNSHKPSRLGVSINHDYSSNSGLGISYRFVGHDLLDPIVGNPEGIEIRYLEAHASIKPKGVYLDKLTLLHSRSEPLSTELFDDISWDAGLVADRDIFKENIANLSLQGFGLVGKTYSLYGNAFSIKGGLNLAHSSHFDKAVVPMLGTKISYSGTNRNVNYRFEYQLFEAINEQKINSRQFNFLLAMPSTANRAWFAKLEHSKGVGTDLQLGYLVYF